MMNLTKSLVILVSVASLILTFSFDAFAADNANKKRGQVYFKMVCTVCHMEMSERTIPPADYTMQQWRNYFDAGTHDKSGRSNPKLSYYVSTEYRESIRDSNKAAKRFLKLSNEELYADVSMFAVSGAKDSDTPATCN